MKKWISVLCVCALVIGMAAFSAVSAAADDFEKGSNAVDVKAGDEVSYELYLDKIAQPVIGSDFSVYYDPDVFELVSVADYNNKTKESEWEAVINTGLEGQVKEVWSILKGVDFSSKRNLITLNLKAKEDAKDSHLSYRIRYLYDNDVFNSADYPQISEYEFTVDVLVNGEVVLDDALAEYNADAPEENGKFVNSADGKSEHADPNLPGVVDKTKAKKSADNNSGNNSDDVQVLDGNNNSGANGSGGGSGANGSGGSVNGGSSSSAAAAPLATTAEGYFITATDAEGNAVATSDQAPVAVNNADDGQNKGGSPILWIIIAVVVIAGGGAAVYFFMKKPKNEGGADAAAAPVSETAEEAAPVEDAAPVEEAVAEPETEASADENKD